MAGKIIKEKSATITSAASTGYVTIASTTGWYAGAKGSISKPATASRMVVITEILSSTQLGVRLLPDDWHVVGAAGPNYGRSDVSAYSGGTGTLVQFEQFLFNPDEKPLD